MIVAVSLRLLYLLFLQVLRLVLLLGRPSSTKDIELLVLRHEVAVLRRTNPRPRLEWADRAVFAALDPAAASSTALPSPGHPEHDLRWHRRLVRNFERLFRADRPLHLLETGVQAIQLFTISRGPLSASSHAPGPDH